MPRRKKPDIEDSEEIENIISSFKKTKIKLKKIDFSDNDIEGSVPDHWMALSNLCKFVSGKCKYFASSSLD